MHLPDGFLAPAVWAPLNVAAAGAVGLSLRGLQREGDAVSRAALAPRLGVMAAYVFAAQMINFPVAAGTSGHLLGAMLAAAVLGPRAATVVMAGVFLAQCLIFQDGGVTVLGANVFNMGILGAWGGYAVYRAVLGRAPTEQRQLVGVAMGAWTAVMLGAAATAVQLAISGTVPAHLVIPAMLGVHAVIGVGEAAITVAAVALLQRARPDLLGLTAAPPPANRAWVWPLAAGLALVAALAPLASGAPDGLEHVAERLGFVGFAGDHPLPGVAPDYELPAFGAWSGGSIFVSLLGGGLTLGLVYAAAVPVLGRCRYGLTPFQRIDPRVRLAGALAVAVAAAVAPAAHPERLLALFLLSLLAVVAARLRWGWLAPRLAMLVPLVALAALSAPFHAGGNAGWFYAILVLRGVTSLLAMATFFGSVTLDQALAALRAYHVPPLVVEGLGFSLRYLSVFRDEAGRMLQARASRGPGGTLALRASVTGAMVGSLFIRSYERAERVAQAMAARGYAGAAVGVRAAPLALGDWLVILLFCGSLGALALWP